MPRILCGTKLSSKNQKDIAIMVRPWQLSRSESIVFLQKVYGQNCAPETSACHPPLSRLYEVLFPGKLLFLKSAFESALKCINTRTSLELRKHKCYFPTFHWWSMVVQRLLMRGKHSITLDLQRPLLPLFCLPASEEKVMTKACLLHEPKLCPKSQTKS